MLIYALVDPGTCGGYIAADEVLSDNPGRCRRRRLSLRDSQWCWQNDAALPKQLVSKASVKVLFRVQR
jgi:hypothetical protein